MVQGLAFLSKKSWHVKNMANQEKVWMAEQREAAEKAKTSELAKQIQQEKEQEEMEAMTGKKATMDRGIDWMYTGQNASSEIAQQDESKKQEEYLLGKEYAPEGAARGDLDDGKAMEGVNAAVMAASKATVEEAAVVPTEPSVADRNESFRQRYEDPMFAVSKEVYSRNQKYEKKKELYEKVVGGVAVEKKKKSDKSEKRKRKKHRRRDRSRSPSRDRKRSRKSDDRRRGSDRHRSRREYSDDSGSDVRSQDRSRRRGGRDRRSPSIDDRRSRKRSESDNESNYDRKGRYDRSRDRQRGGRQRDHRTRDDDYDNDERRYSNHRKQCRNHDDDASETSYSQRHGHRNLKEAPPSRSGADDRRRQNRDSNNRKRPPSPQVFKKPAGYGLQGGSQKRDANSCSLGPDAKLLKEKREARQAEQDRLQQLSKRRQPRTAAERQQTLANMQSAAAARNESQDKDNRKPPPPSEDGPRRGAAFLHSMAQEAHGLKGSTDLQERLRQNRHTNQRGVDDDFL